MKFSQNILRTLILGIILITPFFFASPVFADVLDPGTINTCGEIEALGTYTLGENIGDGEGTEVALDPLGPTDTCITVNYAVNDVDIANNGFTITGLVSFSDGASNSDSFTGNAVFNGASLHENGTITGDVTFNDTSYNDTAFIIGTATFNGVGTNNQGTVTGNAIFNTGAQDYDTVTGQAKYTYATGGVITLPSGATWADFTEGSTVGNDDQPFDEWIFESGSGNGSTTTLVGTATFNGDSVNNEGAIVSGVATFNDTSYNVGTVEGEANFYDSSTNGLEDPATDGIVNDIATFYGDLSENFGTLNSGGYRHYTSTITPARDLSSWNVTVDGASVVLTLTPGNLDQYTDIYTINGGSVAPLGTDCSSSLIGGGVVYELTGNVTGDCTINNPGPDYNNVNSLVLDGADFTVDGDVLSSYEETGQGSMITLRDITVTGAVVTDPPSGGGNPGGPIIIDNSTIGSVSANAISVDTNYNGGTVTITDSTVGAISSIGSNNEAGDGGNGGAVTITNSTTTTITTGGGASTGGTGGDGGAITFTDATYTDSTYTSATAAAGSGGGGTAGNVKFNSASGGSITIPTGGVWAVVAGTPKGSDDATITDWIFNGNSTNTGTVAGSATFNSTSSNASGGTVSGNATFNSTSTNASGATVSGNATFNNTSYAYNFSPGTVSGTKTVTGPFTIATGQTWSGNDSTWLGTRTWTFNGTSTNTGTATGTTAFNNSSYNDGTVTGPRLLIARVTTKAQLREPRHLTAQAIMTAPSLVLRHLTPQATTILQVR